MYTNNLLISESAPEAVSCVSVARLTQRSPSIAAVVTSDSTAGGFI